MPVAVVVVAAPLLMSVEERGRLEVIAGSSVLLHRQVVQARALLLAGDGAANNEIARLCGTTPDTVRRWRRCRTGFAKPIFWTEPSLG